MRSGKSIAWVVGSILLAGCESPEDYARVNRQPEIDELVGQWTMLPALADQALSLATDGRASALDLTLRADQSCALEPSFIDFLSDCNEATTPATDRLLCHWGTVQTDGEWEVQVVASPEDEGDWVFARMGLFRHVKGHYSLSGACVSGTGYALYRHSAECALHQVYKFSHDGRPLLTLGERAVPGDDSSHFNLPTDIAVAADGSFYVTDGYGNNRVLKFSADGRFLFQWGAKGTGPGHFDLPTGITLDAAGRVYVADRGNARVQVFDATGKYLSQWHGPAIGRPYDVAIGKEGVAFVADGGDQPLTGPDRSALVVVRSDGSVRERVGRFGNYDGQFAIAHDLAVSADGAVYVGDITGRRIQKFVRDAR